MRCVVLLSGGIDSSTCLAIARSMGYECHAMTVLYGQRHSREVRSAEAVSRSLGAVEHRVIELPTGTLDGSSLTGGSEVPRDRDIDEVRDIPSTYVPARNLLFLSMAVSWAEVIDADAVFIGATSIDYSGYPDCRPEFLRSFQRTSELATKRGAEGRPIKIMAPLLKMSKGEIIKKGRELGLDLGMTWSCYSGGERPCMACDSCLFRAKGFAEAGMTDPLLVGRGPVDDERGR